MSMFTQCKGWKLSACHPSEVGEVSTSVLGPVYAPVKIGVPYPCVVRGDQGCVRKGTGVKPVPNHYADHNGWSAVVTPNGSSRKKNNRTQHAEFGGDWSRSQQRENTELHIWIPLTLLPIKHLAKLLHSKTQLLDHKSSRVGSQNTWESESERIPKVMESIVFSSKSCVPNPSPCTHLTQS